MFRLNMIPAVPTLPSQINQNNFPILLPNYSLEQLCFLFGVFMYWRQVTNSYGREEKKFLQVALLKPRLPF